MNRKELIKQVIEGYSNIAYHDNQQHFSQTTNDFTAHQYYSDLCNAVIDEISKGRFDTCHSGLEIVNKVAVDKSLLPEWQG